MKFIDRSIPELLDINSSVKAERIIEFISLLYTAGVDFFEIDKRSIDSIKDFPQDIKYVFRVSNFIDLRYLDEYNFKNFIVSIKNNSYETQSKIIEAISNKFAADLDFKIILEVPANSFEEIEQYFHFYESNLLYKVHGLRIVGLGSCISLNIKNWIINTKQKYKIEIDICAENTHFCATGAAVNLLSDEIDFITGSFSGIGGEFGYAPIEEVIMAAKVIYDMDLRGDTRVFQKLKMLVEDISGTIIPKDKPVIGSDIFLCESGVHVDGIMKNPKNYEPFDPEIVGLKRRIVLGKHSGATAVEWILKQYNINYKVNDIPIILRRIQERSVELKSFFDGEALRGLVAELNVY